MASSAQAGGGLSIFHIQNQSAASHHTETCNVVIFGETGAGKSSLINLVAGTQTALTSPDAAGCTTETKAYNILIQNNTLKVKLYDTVGLGEGPEGTVPDREARRVLKKLLRDLMKQIDIHLLMYCVRGVRATKALCRNYDLIRSEVKEGVPIVLVATALEDQAPEMEEWWRKNEKLISDFGMTFAGHACVTTATIDKYAEDSLRRRRKQSYHAVCQLIERCRLSKAVQTPLSEVGRWLSTIRHVSTMTTRKVHKDIVLTDETATLMAEEEVAHTAPDLLCWTLEYTETIDLDDEISKVFEITRLEDAHPRIKEHPIPPDIGARNNTTIILTGETEDSDDSSVELMAGDEVVPMVPDMQRCMLQCSDTVDLDDETPEAPETIEDPHLGIREYPIPPDMGARNNDNSILFTGQTAASDGSPVKLMAGDEVTPTTPDVRRRMLQRSETLDDEIFKAFLPLMDPRLRIRGYAITPQMGARNNDKDIVLTGGRVASNCSPVNLMAAALDMQRRMLQHSDTVCLDDKTFKAFIRLVDPRPRIRGYTSYTVPSKMSARKKYKSILPFCRLEDLHLRIKEFSIPSNIGVMDKHKIFALFWQTGAGKNSLFNMMAVASTAPDTRHRMLQCTEAVDSHDETSAAFETARLEELHLGIIEYFIPPKVGVRNKHKISVLFWQTGAGKSSLISLITREKVVPTAPDMRRRMLQCSENVNLDVRNVEAFLRLEDPHLRIRGYPILPKMCIKTKHEIVALFWQTGAGKSSLVNLMTRLEVAPTVPDMRRRMLQFSETNFDDKASKAFLPPEDPHLRIKGYFIPPRMASTNKHEYIVPFPQTGAGKSSLIKVIPEEEVAPTAPDTQRHIPQCSETVNTDDKTSKVFLPLEDPHLRTRRYPVPPKMSTRNKHQSIVLFGDTGAGKSSLINLMAGKEVAGTSPDTERCTMHWQEYNICFGDMSYKVFDTVGLEAPDLGIKEYLEFVENAYQLIKRLDKQGGIDLLLFCVRAGRVTATLQNNYRLFHEFLCEKKVPIVLAITGLERELRMEDYWERNKGIFSRYQIQVAGHACITAADRLDGRHKDLYEESRVTIRNLVEQFTADGQKQAWMGGDNLFVSLMRKLKELLVGSSHVRRRDLVPHLTKRCGMSREVAKQLADMIKQDEAA